MFIASMIEPSGKVLYLPKGFGFTAHEWATDASDAEVFGTEGQARQRILAFIQPPAFWGSERKHKELMQEKYGKNMVNIAPYTNLTK